MTIKVGDKLPSAELMMMTETGPARLSVADMFGGKKIAIFALPGAFTPTCSAKHLPGFIDQFGALKDKGVDDVLCLSVNDPFVMAAWGKAQSAGDIKMVADPNASYTKALGLEFDASKAGLGTRSLRYSMIVDDGTVTEFNLDEIGSFEVSDAQTLLGQL